MIPGIRNLSTLRRQLKHYLLKWRVAQYPIIPVLIIAFFVFTAVFGGILAPYKASQVDLEDRLMPPLWQSGGTMRHPLGTDQIGRDILSRIMIGSRVSLLVALLAIVLGGMAGTGLGIIAGFYGGVVGTVIMRAADATLAFPIVLLALVMAVSMGPSVTVVAIAISIAIWARYAWGIRGDVLGIMGKDFVAFSRIAGCSPWWIISRHIFPNVLNTLLVLLTLQVGWVILVESMLSFLGAGIPPPAPAWGSMVADGKEYIVSAWWVSGVPGIAILLVVLAFNLTGDWLREILDPKLRQSAVA